VLGGLQVRLRRGDGGLRRGRREPGGVEPRLRDRLALEQGLAPLELRRGGLELRLRHREVRLPLRQVALRNARVDPRQQLALLHRDPPLCRRPGSPPPVTFWNRCLNCCCACTSEALGSTRTVSRSVSPLVTSM